MKEETLQFFLLFFISSRADEHTREIHVKSGWLRLSSMQIREGKIALNTTHHRKILDNRDNIQNHQIIEYLLTLFRRGETGRFTGKLSCSVY